MAQKVKIRRKKKNNAKGLKVRVVNSSKGTRKRR